MSQLGLYLGTQRGGEVGAIGHNCVVPLHRRKRYGKKQILMAEKQSPRHVHLIKVTTANYSFILPARRTYLSCGFTEVERSQTDAYGGLELIHYEHVRKQRYLNPQPPNTSQSLEICSLSDPLPMLGVVVLAQRVFPTPVAPLRLNPVLR